MDLESRDRILQACGALRLPCAISRRLHVGGAKLERDGTRCPSGEKKYLKDVRAVFEKRPALVGAADALRGDLVGTVQDSRTRMLELNLRAGLLAAPLLVPIVDLIEAGMVTQELREEFIEGLADVIEVYIKNNEPAESLDELLDRIANPRPVDRYSKSLYAREISKLLILNMVFKEMLRWEWRMMCSNTPLRNLP
jgi:hypothetical protein